jgi:hypothetical protein
MNRASLALAVSLAAFLAAPAAHAESARELKDRCTGMTGIVNASECKASVGGSVNALRDDPVYCIPKDLDNKTALGVVQKYLPAHPADWSLTGHEAVAKAMAEAYPCPAKP